MKINSNSIFHYTDSPEKIISILKSGFRPSYCKEEIHYGKTYLRYAIPMISFCDIPLTRVTDHVKKYGSYAIGLATEWATKNKLNPVLYIEKNSNLSTGLLKVLDFVQQGEWHNNIEDDEEFMEFYDNVFKGSMNVIYFLKNYKGRLIRNGTDQDYKFYDEREWRYVPSIAYTDADKYPDIYWEQDFLKLSTDFPKKPHFDKHVVKFTAADIKYLVVENETGISKIMNELRTIDNLYKNQSDYELLLTKFITLKQIEDDF